MILSRRALAGGLIAAPVLGASFYAAQAYAQSQSRCRVPRFPTVRRCLDECNGSWSTLQCQVGALFPVPEQLRGGVLIGAILGGVVGWVVSGDIEDILAGAAVGGVIGGATQAAANYRHYQTSRARGDDEGAFRNTVADRSDDGERITLLATEQTLRDQTALVRAVPAQLERGGARAVREAAQSLGFAGTVMGAIEAAANNSGTALDVLQDSASFFAGRIGRPLIPSDDAVRERLATTRRDTSGVTREIAELQSHPLLRAVPPG